jgi:benzoyl-CoA reductase/2-hydroxyglutaryl-CoA dehydratase subunit BcrC/BadD/HgdB
MCSYTPLILIDTAGFVPFRILPSGSSPDNAGLFLHENMCPHVKRVLDRAIASDIPELAGVVFMNSCESMRRLFDAWKLVRPEMPSFIIDLPAVTDSAAQAYFAEKLKRFWNFLCDLAGHEFLLQNIDAGILKYNNLAKKLLKFASDIDAGLIAGGRGLLQQAINNAVMLSAEDACARIDALYERMISDAKPDGVPVYLFGNILPDPESFDLFEKAGLRIVNDDLCTGNRQFPVIDISENTGAFRNIANTLLKRSPCARTIINPGQFGVHIAESAEKHGASVVIAHVMKFCDPYLARMPAVREILNRHSLPLLILEGDCASRSLEQHRTRLEAFAEMIGGF